MGPLGLTRNIEKGTLGYSCRLTAPTIAQPSKSSSRGYGRRKARRSWEYLLARIEQFVQKQLQKKLDEIERRAEAITRFGIHEPQMAMQILGSATTTAFDYVMRSVPPRATNATAKMLDALVATARLRILTPEGGTYPAGPVRHSTAHS